MAQARPLRIQTAGLKELQARMKRLEVSLEPGAVKPILAAALVPIKDRALENLRAIPGIKLGGKLKLRNQQHIEDELIVSEGKSSRIATAFCKVWRKFAPQGVWLELGHKVWRGGSRRKGIGRQIGETEPHPFFRPAVDSERANVRRTIEEGIVKLLWDSEK
jgi:hypothetical protein